ncbi:MAG: PilN domain-containing protein [Pseudomonadota bacterium]
MSQQINLYQPIFRRQEKKFSTTAMLQGAGLVLAGIVVMYGYTQWQVRSLRGELVQTDQKHAVAAKRLVEVTEKFGGERKPGKSLDDEIIRLEQEIVARQRIQDILQRGLFSNTRGFSEYFVSFARQQVSGLWLTGLDITGAADQMSLQGRSINPELVPQYMQRLSVEKPLSGIEFRVFQMNRPPADAKEAAGPYIEFQIKTAGKSG